MASVSPTSPSSFVSVASRHGGLAAEEEVAQDAHGVGDVDLPVGVRVAADEPRPAAPSRHARPRSASKAL